MVETLTQSEEVGAPPTACFAQLVDMERYPEWQSAVRTVEIRTRDRAGRPEVVRFEIDLHVRRVSYTLRYTHEPPHRLTWTFVEGDVADISGSYLLEPLGHDRTRATYALAVDLGRAVPGLLVRRTGAAAMRRSILELKSRVEAPIPSA